MWPGGSCQGKSVCRSHALGGAEGGRGSRQLWAGAQNRKEKKKVKRCNSGPGLGPSLCSLASARQAWVQSGPTCLHSDFNHQLCYVLARYFPKFQNPKTTRAGSCLAYVCLCLRLCSFLLVTVTDRACACLCLKRPPPPPPSLQAELPTSSVSTILLTSATPSFCLSSLALLNPLANLRGPLSVNLFFSSTKYSILARDYQFTPADCPTRQHSRELGSYAHTQSKCLQPRPSDRLLPTPSVSLLSGSLESAPFPVGHPSACQSRRPPRPPFSKSHADLVMLCNSCRRPHPQASPCQPQPVSPQ